MKTACEGAAAAASLLMMMMMMMMMTTNTQRLNETAHETSCRWFMQIRKQSDVNKLHSQLAPWTCSGSEGCIQWSHDPQLIFHKISRRKMSTLYKDVHWVIDRTNRADLTVWSHLKSSSPGEQEHLQTASYQPESRLCLRPERLKGSNVLNISCNEQQENQVTTKFIFSNSNHETGICQRDGDDDADVAE